MAEPLRYPRPTVLSRVPTSGHVVIEASAGTGKTHTLEHLVVDLVLTGQASIDQLLIVTFTEPATAELKARVRGKIEELVRLDDHKCDEETPHWTIGESERQLLQDQLDKFGRSSIHTIHGFCHRVLVENAFHLRRLFDEEHSDSGAIFDMAFKRALREQYATDPALRPYLLAWLERNDLASLGRALAGLVVEDARLEPRFAEGSLRGALDNLAALAPEDLRNTNKAFASTLRQVVPDNWVHDKMTKLVDDLCDAIPDYADSGDLAALLAHTDRQLSFLLQGSKYTDNMFQHFREARPPAGSTQVSLHAALVRLIPLRAAVLHVLLPTVREKLGEVKAAGYFDYDDMLTGVWEQLQDQSDPNARVLVNTLRRRYRVALIDEFQDTDPTQWNIFRRIFFDSPDAANRLFVIGDPKQAIYGFRGADVHTYIEAKDAILERRGEGDAVRLKENYRSTEPLIAGYNQVFDQAAEKPFFDGPIRYDAPVVCGQPEMRALDGDADLVPIRVVRAVPKGDKLDAYAFKRTLGKWIAQETARLIKAELRVVDETRDVDRVIGPEDIYILVRNRSEARRMGQYLREVGVPFAFYKEEGLFQTAEARYVLDLLVAIAEPRSRSNRFKAWSTPFFDVPFEQLSHCADLPETHPLVSTLLDWHVWSTRGEFERLFADVLDRSGVVRREIFAGPSERVLTNITHIFEILLEEVHRERAALSDLIVRLRGFVDQATYPQSSERNIQRLETDKAAVQVMTIHKSKGLQADVVFVYGGMSAAPAADRARVCHQNDERVLYMGLPQSSAAMQVVVKEAREEDQRLLYVAVTRARALVYLPFVGTVKGELQYTKLDGTYKVVNDRLQKIVDAGVDPRLFEVVEARAERFQAEDGRLHMPPAGTYRSWRPPPALPEFGADVESLRSAPLIVSSYSRMKRTSEYIDDSGTREAFMREVSARAEAFRGEDELPGGTDTGIFLHDILERVDFKSASGVPFEDWCAQPENAGLVDESMREHGIAPRFTEYIRKMVWSTLTTSFPLPDGTTLGGLSEVARDLREVEFLFPIPESQNPRIDVVPPPDVRFDVRRGYLKGFIDLVFEHDGRVYFADWKSDSLHAFGEESLREHVTSHYETQAWLYSLATLKMFGIHDAKSFDERFGGYMYAFLRGIDGTPGRGFYVHRPAFDAIQAYERKLEEATFR